MATQYVWGGIHGIYSRVQVLKWNAFRSRIRRAACPKERRSGGERGKLKILWTRSGEVLTTVRWVSMGSGPVGESSTFHGAPSGQSK